MSATYTVRLASRVLSPCTHMARSEGNESLIAREPVMTPDGTRWLPVLSGNQIRHRLVREPGMRWLIDAYGLAGTLTLSQLNFLLHGGNLTEGGGREDTARIAAFQQLWPLGRLCGGCLPDQVLRGSLEVWRGRLACRENAPFLPADLGEFAAALPAQLRPAETFLSGWQYTRADAAKTAPDLLPVPSPMPPDGRAPDSNLMIFSGQAVMPGAVFVHGFTLPNVSRHELGALLWSLRLWQAAGGTIGGQAARGHGRLATALLGAIPGADEATEGYVDYARSVRDEAVAWLHGVFAPRPAKAAKAKAGKAKLPEDNYTEAACDGCGAACPESRIPGRRGVKAADEAHAAAKAHGWTEKFVRKRGGKQGKGRYYTAIDLLCPGCRAKVETEGAPPCAS